MLSNDAVGLLDGDIIPYEFASAVDSDGDDIPVGWVMKRMYDRLEKIQERSGVSVMNIFITSLDKSNFRYDVATIKPYKGHRPTEKGPHWEAIREELRTNCGAEVVHGMEADDAIAIRQYEAISRDERCYEDTKVSTFGDIVPPIYSTVILSRDKDLRMVPGWHYGWGAGNCKERELHFILKMEGLRWFYTQILTGDTVDNIPGLFGVGAKSKLVKDLEEFNNEKEMFDHVHAKYKDRFGSYADQFLLENARLLFMLQYEGQLWKFPT